MESMNETTDINIHFVIENKFSSEQECSEDMWHAFNKCDELDTKPKWILEADCLKMEPQKVDVFIIETFSGEVFEYLQKFKCSIYGPKCLLKCFTTGKPLPSTKAPVLNTAMENIVVSSTGLSATEKEEFQKKIEYMGGVFLKTLRRCNTHLIANTIITEKYERAVQSGLTVVKPEWVEAVWKANLTEFVPAQDPRFDRYKCPVFFNLVVTTSNIHMALKEKITQAIREHGGDFMGALDYKKVKMVITIEDNVPSKKITFAHQNNIPCVSYEWVFSSIEAGHALPLNNYIIGPFRKCSTPEKADAVLPNNSSIDISRISCANSDFTRVIQETIQADSSSMSSVIINAGNKPNHSSTAYAVVVDKINIEDVKKAGSFLDGCSVYLIGFSSIHREKLNKVLSFSGATRLDAPTESLTHVIVGDTTKSAAEIKLIQSKDITPFIVNTQWLYESVKIRRPAFEDDFLIEPRQKGVKRKIEPASPLSKKGLAMMSQSKSRNLSNHSIRQLSSADSGNPTEEDSEETDLVMKYLQAPESNSQSTIMRQNSNKSMTLEQNCQSTSVIATTATSDMENESIISFSQDPKALTLFKGYTFVIGKFPEEDVVSCTKLIKYHGGKVINNSSEVADFGVVPINGTMDREVKNIVTDLYIEECIELVEMLEIEYYHHPILISKNVKPLEDCVISITSFKSAERKYLQALSEILGARYQDTFARTSKMSKEQMTYANTHLICAKAEGKKYIAAIKWKIPALTSEWLVSCAKTGTRVDETPFLLGSSSVPEKSKETLQKNENVSHNNCTPPPLQPINVDDERTPTTKLVNKRLNSVKDLNPSSLHSPFHVDTPTTPYGRCFQENPSREMSKNLKKWVDSLPNWYESPPVKKKARHSTPLSELKRRLMEKCLMESEAAVNGPSKGSTSDDEDQSSLLDAQTKRKLSFSKETEIDPVEEIKQTLKSASDLRESLSGENRQINNQENVEEQMNNYPVMDTQFDIIGWENKEQRPPVNVVPKENKKKFMMSGTKDRQVLEEIILNLGGEVSDLPYFDPDATHLICPKPGRNEKMLGSIASGKWVLHVHYLLDSEQSGQFLDEEEYEFGNPKSKDNIPPLSGETERLVAAAVYKWRTKLLKEPGGAFKDMVAVLIVQPDKYDQFKRLIVAGGGIVEDGKCYDVTSCGRKITHCFVQPKQVDQQIEWAKLANKGIYCFLPQYLSDHLIAETTLNPRECVLPEFKKYLSLIPS